MGGAEPNGCTGEGRPSHGRGDIGQNLAMNFSVAEICAACWSDTDAASTGVLYRPGGDTGPWVRVGGDDLDLGHDRTVESVEIDSRASRPGSLFVPLVAERDGHDFVGDAVIGGCTAFLCNSANVAAVAEQLADIDPDATPVGIVVDDTMQALRRLARLARSELQGTVVGITGSVGKTSTKDLAKSAIGAHLRVSASEKSFNNEIGVPLTLLAAQRTDDVVLVEMGARGAGHIAELCELARPHVGAITLVAGAHLSEFGTVEAIADAKFELFAALPADGTALFNTADPLTEARIASLIASDPGAAPDAVGVGPGGAVWADEVELDDELRPAFTLHTPSGSARVRLPLHGLHHVQNAAMAAAIGLAVRVPLAQLVDGLVAATPSPWRMELVRWANGLLIINDAYNANPTSMLAALDALAQARAERRVAICGYMAELGPDEEAAHRAIAEHARSLGVELWPVGTDLYGAGRPLAIEDAAEAMRSLGEHTVVLIKASRAAGLETLAYE